MSLAIPWHACRYSQKSRLASGQLSNGPTTFGEASSFGWSLVRSPLLRDSVAYYTIGVVQKVVGQSLFFGAGD